MTEVWVVSTLDYDERWLVPVKAFPTYETALEFAEAMDEPGDVRRVEVES